MDHDQRRQDASHVERLYAVAIEDHPGSAEFLDRMSWLPDLIGNQINRLDA